MDATKLQLNTLQTKKMAEKIFSSVKILRLHGEKPLPKRGKRLNEEVSGKSKDTKDTNKESS